jgi:hypothetical protein
MAILDPAEIDRAERTARDELSARLITLAKPPAPGLPIPVIDPGLVRDLGLPPRPGEGASKERVDFWNSLVGGPLRLLERQRDWDFVLRPPGALRSLTRHLMGGESTGSLSGSTGAIRGRWGTSGNWSGAVIAARDGGRFTNVEGSWTVPAAAQPAGPVPAGGVPGGVWKQSVWIGLDGYKLCSKSLPQMGTVSMFDPAKAGTVDDQGRPYAGEYHLWIQWWVRGKFHGEAMIGGFPVAAGDRISASLTVTARDDVRFFVRNDGPEGSAAQPFAVAAVWQSGSVFDEAGNRVGTFTQAGETTLDRSKAPAEGQHAIWCVERPAVMPSEERRRTIRPNEIENYVMPSFGKAVFSKVLAAMRLPDGRMVQRDLTAARRIRMIEVVRGPVPRVVFATCPLPPDRANPASTSKGSLTVEQEVGGA